MWLSQPVKSRDKSIVVKIPDNVDCESHEIKRLMSQVSQDKLTQKISQFKKRWNQTYYKLWQTVVNGPPLGVSVTDTNHEVVDSISGTYVD